MSLPNVEINYSAILIATVVSFIFGWLWYSPFLFGKIWAKLSKVKMGAGKSMGFLMIVNLIGILVLVVTMAYLVKVLTISDLNGALILGALVWLGFFASTTLLGGYLWENKPFKAVLIGAGYWLINLEIVSVILIYWN